MALEFVEGWTGPLDVQLKADGIAVDLTGMTVDLVLRRADRYLVSSTGDVTVLSATSGTVRFSPDAADFVAAHGPYTARYKVTDSGGKIVFFPSGEPDVWTVRRL